MTHAKNQSNPLKTRLREVLLEMYIRLKYLRIYSYLRIKHTSWFLVLWDICRRVLTQSNPQFEFKKLCSDTSDVFRVLWGIPNSEGRGTAVTPPEAPRI